MKTIRRISLLIIIGLISTSIYCQISSVDVLKKENSQLKNDLAKTKLEKESLQTVNLKLKQDTTFLRSELALCILYNTGQKTEIVNSNGNFRATYISCKGRRASQSVELTFMIQHNIPNQEFSNNPADSDKGMAYDTQGQVYNANAIYIGGVKSNSGMIPTSIPVRITLVFNNVLPGNDFFKVVRFKYDSYNTDYSNKQNGTLEFRNIKVIWD